MKYEIKCCRSTHWVEGVPGNWVVYSEDESAGANVAVYSGDDSFEHSSLFQSQAETCEEALIESGMPKMNIRTITLIEK